MRHALIRRQRDGALVNGCAAVERQHAEPGVIHGDVAGIGGGGVAVTYLRGASNHSRTGHIEGCGLPVCFTSNVARIIQRRYKTVEINIAGIARSTFGG